MKAKMKETKNVKRYTNFLLNVKKVSNENARLIQEENIITNFLASISKDFRKKVKKSKKNTCIIF